MNVADIMSSPVYVINADEPVSHARKLMLRHKISTLLVLNEGKMVESSQNQTSLTGWLRPNLSGGGGQ